MERPLRKDFEWPDYFQKAINEYCDQLEAERKWISVNDKLPKYNYCPVLVFINASNAKETHMAALGKNNEWEILSEKGNHSQFITHWMPLPSAPTNQ